MAIDISEDNFNLLYKVLVVKNKGQAAIEYMTVFAIALALSTPFIMKAQTSILELRSGSNTVSAQNTLNDIEVAIETVSASGEPATRTFNVKIPQTVNSTEVNRREVAIILNTQSGVSRYSRTFNVNLTGALPSDGGQYRLKTEAVGGEVNLEVVS